MTYNSYGVCLQVICEGLPKIRECGITLETSASTSKPD